MSKPILLAMLLLGCAQRAQAESGADKVASLTASCATVRLSCDTLADIYAKGLYDVPIDLPRAAGLYRKACDAGLRLGCNHLGALYALGRGVDKDPVKALALYGQACDAGLELACDHLAALKP
jgi:TPR repeat protein